MRDYNFNPTKSANYTQDENLEGENYGSIVSWNYILIMGLITSIIIVVFSLIQSKKKNLTLEVNTETLEEIASNIKDSSTVFTPLISKRIVNELPRSVDKKYLSLNPTHPGLLNKLQQTVANDNSILEKTKAFAPGIATKPQSHVLDKISNPLERQADLIPKAVADPSSLAFTQKKLKVKRLKHSKFGLNSSKKLGNFEIKNTEQPKFDIPLSNSESQTTSSMNPSTFLSNQSANNTDSTAFENNFKDPKESIKASRLEAKSTRTSKLRQEYNEQKYNIKADRESFVKRI